MSNALKFPIQLKLFIKLRSQCKMDMNFRFIICNVINIEFYNKHHHNICMRGKYPCMTLLYTYIHVKKREYN